jgi:glutamyl-tRNA reductase
LAASKGQLSDDKSRHTDTAVMEEQRTQTRPADGGMTATVAVAGVSHLRAPAALRERLYLAPDAAAALAGSLAAGVHEAVVLATCNRTELYLTGNDREDAERRAKRALTDLGDGTDVASAAYVHAGEDAARHLFRVAAGLDAIVLGDTHVAAQVRHAHRAARGAGATGPLLDRLFEAAAVASKRIRSETSVSLGPTSIPAAAIAAAARFAGPLSERRLLVIGAGTIARLAALNAASRGCRQIVIANRALARARELAERVGGRATTLDALETEVADADIVVSATAAAGFVLTRDIAAASPFLQRDRSPRAIFDLALPRDVDPALRDARGLQLLDLDDLGRLVALNAGGRRSDLARATAIAHEEAERYETWRRARLATPAIVALRRNGETARLTVLSRHAAALAELADADRGLVETITSQLVAKLLHQPILELRRLAVARAIDGVEAGPASPTSVFPSRPARPPGFARARSLARDASLEETPERR